MSSLNASLFQLQSCYSKVAALPEDQFLSFNEEEELESVDAPEAISYCCYTYSAELSDTEKARNKRSWQIFERIVRATFLEKEVSRFCSRYKLNFQEAIDKGSPLKARHIQSIGVGAAKVFKSDLADRGSITKEEVAQYLSSARTRAHLGQEIPVERIRGGAESVGDMLQYNPLKLDREKLSYYEHLSKNRDALTEDQVFPFPFAGFPAFEGLAKVLVSKEFEKGEIITTLDEGGELDYYSVYSKINVAGLVAYALVPIAVDSQMRHAIFIRPTQVAPTMENAVPSWINDLEYNIGESGAGAAKKLFEQLFNDTNFFNGPIDLVGYSLGGTHAQRLLVEFWKRIARVFFFNDPGVDEATAERFRKEISAAGSDHKPEIHIFRNENDKADHVGTEHLGAGLAGVRVKLTVFQKLPPGGPHFGTHATRVGELYNKSKIIENQASMVVYHDGEKITHRYTESGTLQRTSESDPEALSRELITKNRGADILWWEELRLSCITRLFHQIIVGLYACFRGIFECFGVEFFRTNSHEDLTRLETEDSI
ncbi:MAG: hypothetical protein HYX48_01515 [Chlamydiales bacterium]|nr:hypothetical protein [Chlamydiales bacterium]